MEAETTSEAGIAHQRPRPLANTFHRTDSSLMRFATPVAIFRRNGATPVAADARSASPARPNCGCQARPKSCQTVSSEAQGVGSFPYGRQRGGLFRGIGTPYPPHEQHDDLDFVGGDGGVAHFKH